MCRTTGLDGSASLGCPNVVFSYRAQVGLVEIQSEGCLIKVQTRSCTKKDALNVLMKSLAWPQVTTNIDQI